MSRAVDRSSEAEQQSDGTDDQYIKWQSLARLLSLRIFMHESPQRQAKESSSIPEPGPRPSTHEKPAKEVPVECTFNSGRHRGRSFRDVFYNEPGSRDLFQSLDWEERPRYLGTSPDEADAFLEYCAAVSMTTSTPTPKPSTASSDPSGLTEVETREDGGREKDRARHEELSEGLDTLSDALEEERERHGKRWELTMGPPATAGVLRLSPICVAFNPRRVAAEFAFACRKLPAALAARFARSCRKLPARLAKSLPHCLMQSIWGHFGDSQKDPDLLPHCLMQPIWGHFGDSQKEPDLLPHCLFHLFWGQPKRARIV